MCQILNQHLEQARLGFKSIPIKGIILYFERKVEKVLRKKELEPHEGLEGAPEKVGAPHVMRESITDPPELSVARPE